MREKKKTKEKTKEKTKKSKSSKRVVVHHHFCGLENWNIPDTEDDDSKQ